MNVFPPTLAVMLMYLPAVSPLLLSVPNEYAPLGGEFPYVVMPDRFVGFGSVTSIFATR